MIRVVISGRATVFSDGMPFTRTAVTATDPAVLASLDGYDAGPDPLSEDLDGEPRVDAGATGGTLRFAYDRARNEPSVVTEYRCPRPLTDAGLAHFVRQTEGLWSDGVGEDGFEGEWEGGYGRVYPRTDPEVPRDVRAEQLPE
jgi:hypothetical protein